jgi:hypothetical protein
MIDALIARMLYEQPKTMTSTVDKPFATPKSANS